MITIYNKEDNASLSIHEVDCDVIEIEIEDTRHKEFQTINLTEYQAVSMAKRIIKYFGADL